MSAYVQSNPSPPTNSSTMTESDQVIRSLVFEDERYVHETLRTLDALRQNKHFCDVVLQVGNFEIHAHRAVLACCSPYLFDLFTSSPEGSYEFRYKLNGGFEKEAFEKLVSYAYTARLEINELQVKAVYMAANRLKMATVMHRCGLFLIELLSPENCIGIRSIPGVCRDNELVGKVDKFIQQKIVAVVKSKEFLSLPGIQVEILHKSQKSFTAINERHLCNLVVEWIKQHIDEHSFTFDQMSEKMHMLYVNSDNILHDCNDIQSGDADDSELIQDYKRMSKKMQAPNTKGRKKQPVPAPSKPRHLLYSRSLSDETPVVSEVEEREWHLIACPQTGENTIVALAMIFGTLSRLSVKLRLNVPKESGPVGYSSSSAAQDQESYKLMPPMSDARCAVGAANLNEQLLVCGGYDRGECLKSAQLYDPLRNAWSLLLPMPRSRGRFDMTVVGNKAYAVGGSDGLDELASVECYDAAARKWIPATPLPMPRSNAGVCSSHDKVFCIGGWNGQVGIKRCDVYDPSTSNWTSVAPLQMGRYQVGACALNNFVYAAGGCDAWNCLNAVERYDIANDTWSFVAPLHTARRGCGLAAFDGKLYAVGGSDGSHSLCSVEIYDPSSNCWSPGPKLTTRRANVGVAVVGQRLYAVGGFTGKIFLNTIEVLDVQANEWTTFTLTSLEGGDGTNNSGHGDS